VLTNNLVYLNEEGIESVACNRSDGIGFEILKKLKKSVYIISSEKNPVVSARAKKINVKAFQAVKNKLDVMNEIIDQSEIDKNKVMFIGNDINDYEIMSICPYSACPSDSHPKIKQIATFILERKGGEGIVTSLLEDVMGLDLIEMYLN
jgi:N-acylneuraminate cytidylyltransferase